MTTFFGTDGIRRHCDFFTQKFIHNFANAVSLLPNCRKVAIARDTRTSGSYIEKNLCSSLLDRGIDVLWGGILPSPCLALGTLKCNCDYGIMITASHNPPEYNGLKIFKGDGSKAGNAEETLLEKYLSAPFPLPSAKGELSNFDGKKLYLSNSAAPSLSGMKIFLDCAYGAASGFAASVFRTAGATVVATSDDVESPSLINVNCGADHISRLTHLTGYDAIFAFDGDGDRVQGIINGKIYDGDRILYCLSRIKNSSKAGVCGTIMTNSGYEKKYSEHNIGFYRANVGDSNVFRLMREKSLPLGGEKSGHIIIKDYLLTGDGIHTALEFASIVKNHDLADIDDVQEVPCFSRTLPMVPSFKEFIGYDGTTRIVMRESGTEPVIRILTEDENPALAREKLLSLSEKLNDY